MTAGSMQAVFRQLRQAVLWRDADGMPDELLLRHFIDRRDERAFTALVLRHGPMVLGVCRRVLCDAHDAEDAFQATFLVLARKAAAIGKPQLLGNWLYGVAYRTALEAHGKARRRRSREKQVKDMPHPAAPEGDRREAEREELAALLDRELERLPERYRVPVVLCELQGRSRREVARRLGVPEGTLSSRLAAARKTLARRLARHGLAVSAGALTAALAPAATRAGPAGLPAALVLGTVRAAAGLTAGQAVASAHVTELMEGVLRAMFLRKIKVALAVVLAVALAGGGMVTYRIAASPPVAGPAAAGVAAPDGGAPDGGAPDGGAPDDGAPDGGAPDDDAAKRAREKAVAEAERLEAERRAAAAKAAREKETPAVPAPPVAVDGKGVDFALISVAMRPSGLNPRMPESIAIAGDGVCEYRVEGRPARGKEPAWDAGFLKHTLDRPRLLRLEELLKKTDWLTAPADPKFPPHMHATKYVLTMKRHGQGQTLVFEGDRSAAYKALVTFFEDLARQENLLYRLERLPVRERHDACRQIGEYVLAESGRPYGKPPEGLDLRRYVPTCQRYVRFPYEHSREEILPALRLLGHVRSEADREYIAALANDRDMDVRIAVAEALGKLGGKASVPVLRQMVRSTNEAAWELIRLGPIAVPAVVEAIEAGPGPAGERRPEELDHQKLIRAYIDHWAEVPRPLDPRVLDAVRRSMAGPAGQKYGTQYHRQLLERAAGEGSR